MDKLYVIKIGGQIINDPARLTAFLKQFSSINEPKILVHGGGKLATELAEKLNIPQQMVEGRRITDAETLKIITMVYAGWINKSIVVELQGLGSNNIGLSGADGNLVLAHKRVSGKLDYGFAGDIDKINSAFLVNLLKQNITPVICPVTHDQKGQLLNTNADTIAQEIAKAMAGMYDVVLVYGFEKKGVLRDFQDKDSFIKKIDASEYSLLKQEGVIHSGMIPKIDNAFAAIASGVRQVIIGESEDLNALIHGKTGTVISND